MSDNWNMVKVEKKIQKLADLWLVGEMVNRIGIYGSKVAEGLSAFQLRSCFYIILHFVASLVRVEN